MCIPCVMCGACMNGEGMQGIEDGRCPSCGEIVPPDAVSCPHCYTFLYRKSAASAGELDGKISEQVPKGA